MGRFDIDLDGLLTGLATSTFSTLFVTFGGRHVGRDPQLDFQEVSTWILGDRGISAESDERSVAAGVASHQFADIFWATIFFRWVLPNLPGRRRDAILASAVPWALGTAAAEYWVFLPWIQPWLRMQVPYWTVALAHLGSTAAYPLYPLVQHLRGEQVADGELRTGRTAAVALAGTLVALGALWWYSKRRGDVRWPGVDEDGEEASFLYRMAGHHEVGLRLSELAAERGSNHGLRKLGELMALQHRVELELMDHWHRSWFGREIPDLRREDRRHMSGMPVPEAIDDLAEMVGPDFDRRFAEIMIPHHSSAIEMSREVKAAGRDPRVKLFADGVIHSQLGQIDEMRRLT